jgi:hypothetical protein
MAVVANYGKECSKTGELDPKFHIPYGSNGASSMEQARPVTPNEERGLGDADWKHVGGMEEDFSLRSK